MGWFGANSSKGDTNQNAPEKELPAIRVRQSDLEKANKLLLNFLTAVGTTDQAIRSATVEIAKAGGAEVNPLSKEGFEYYTETGETVSQRPWRWLLVMGGHGFSQGNDELLARIGLFTYTWMTQIKPVCLMADFVDMRLDPPEDDTLVAIYLLSIEALSRMNPQAIIIDHPTATITVQMLLHLSAEQILQFEGMLDADTALLANKLVNEMHELIDKNDTIL